MQYHLNKMYTEALNTYALIVKNRQYANGGRLSKLDLKITLTYSM
jgi:hypothetical protein